MISFPAKTLLLSKRVAANGVSLFRMNEWKSKLSVIWLNALFSFQSVGDADHCSDSVLGLLQTLSARNEEVGVGGLRGQIFFLRVLNWGRYTYEYLSFFFCSAAVGVFLRIAIIIACRW